MKKDLKLVKMKTSTIYIFRTVLLVLCFLFIGIGSSYAQFGMGNTLAPVGASTFPIIYSNDAKGGHHQVANIAARDAIPVLRRLQGMLCTVLDDGSGSAKTYQLIGGVANTNWVEFASSNGVTPSGPDLPAQPVAEGTTFYETDTNILYVSDGAAWNVVGSGSVTTVSVTPANGVSGSVATATTTPAITITLGAITPTSVTATGAVSGTQLTSTVADGTAPLVVTSTTPVTNLSIGGNAGSATNATNTGITDDVATATPVYPTWVTANTGNLPQNVSSTKLSLVPSTGILTASGYVGNSVSTTGNADLTLTTGTGSTIVSNLQSNGAMYIKGFRIASTLAAAAVTATDYIIDLQFSGGGNIFGILPDPTTIAVGRVIVLRNSSARVATAGTYTFGAPDSGYIISNSNTIQSNLSMTLICDGQKWIRIYE